MPKARVLIVDDSAAVVATLRTLLDGCGYEVATALTGAEALEAVRVAQPDVILLDWVLPDTEGPQLLREIRTFCSARCIMITAQDSPEHCVAALDAGCDDFVPKPVRPHELLLRLERILATLPAGE